jgi:hypothetical protein
MDFDEMKGAYTRAQEPYREGSDNTEEVEVDYGIVRMPDNAYLVVRSVRLGSLDYDYVALCANHHEARDIVRALNK